MVSILPKLDEENQTFAIYQPTQEEEKRARRVQPRMQNMLDAREPYMPAMRRGLLNYEGKSRENPDDPRDEQIVMPLSRIFVEAKTAEEVKATNEYIFDPIEGKEWMGKLMGDVNKHVARKTSLAAKRIQMKRMKNLAGVSVGRVGYRKTMRTIKERVEGEDDAVAYEWIEREVPIYDDLFVDIVSPFDFAIDPNARTLNDAMDCVHFHSENFEVFLEAYSKDNRFKNIKSVEPGKGVIFATEGNMKINTTMGKNMVGIAEYFNVIRDEWIIYANGVEIYCGPLPDDHKMLPFFSYHNDPCFVTSMVPPEGAKSPNGGKELAQTENISAHESFWTKGDPETIRDLVDLYTGFARAMFRNAKLAGETIVATQAGHRFDDKRNWRTGDQAVGMMGKFQVESLANSTAGSFEQMLEMIFQIVILATGVDPRSLADGKAKTATETAVQRETSMNRLQQNIDFNNENGEIRLGTLMYKDQVQYYSKPEIVVLTGKETDEELQDFHDVERSPETGLPEYGRRYRRISSTGRFKERRRKVKDGYKYYLSKSEEGMQSFLARPEYIRGAEVDVRISNDRKLGQIQAIQIEQAKDAFNTALAAIQLSQPAAPGMPALIDKADLPNIGFYMKQYVKAQGHNPEEAMGAGKVVSKATQEEDAVMDQFLANPVEINPPPPTPPVSEEDL